MSDTPLFVTVHELSARTGLPVPFLNTEAEAGRMPTKKIGRRTFFDVEAAVRTLTDPNAIERLTAERDEARRELDVMTHEHRLACIDRDAMQRERDEARRMWCEHGTYTHPRQLAKEMRWDCYKEDGK
jgi:hypothetical protein